MVWFGILRVMQMQELARLQGIGPTEWAQYNMQEVGDALMRSFVGNSSPGFNLFGESW